MEPARHPAAESAEPATQAGPGERSSDTQPGMVAGQAAELVRNLNAALIPSLQLRLGASEHPPRAPQEASARLLNSGTDPAVAFHRAPPFRTPQTLATAPLRRAR